MQVGKYQTHPDVVKLIVGNKTDVSERGAHMYMSPCTRAAVDSSTGQMNLIAQLACTTGYSQQGVPVTHILHFMPHPLPVCAQLEGSREVSREEATAFARDHGCLYHGGWVSNGCIAGVSNLSWLGSQAPGYWPLHPTTFQVTQKV
jgi:hypothetical protein